MSNNRMITALFVLALTAPWAATPAGAQAGPPAPDCKQLLVSEPSGDIATLCQAEDAMRLAAAAPAGSPERLQHLRTAADGYGRAAQLLQNLELKVYAYEAVVRVHDPTHLDDPRAVESALRQLATLVAGTPAPLMRLARFQEGHEAVDTAEHTLLGARQQYPDSLAVLRELSAFFARRTMAMLKTEAPAADAVPPKAKESAYRPDCQQAPGDPMGGLAQLCAAEAELRKAAVKPQPAADAQTLARAREAWKQHLRSAAERYAKAAEMLRESEPKMYAYEALVRLYGAQQLNEPREAEQAVRHLMALAPGSTAPIIRLASVQEEQKLTDASERTLLGARQQFPDDVDVLKALSRFYARLATAAQMTESRREREKEKPLVAGQPDENGFYGIGSHLRPPERTRHVTPTYPEEAKAVGMEGIVILEVFVSEGGVVSDVRVLRSIALLDDVAVAAAKQWRFQPTVIDGKPVPVRMTMTIPFPPRPPTVR